MAGFDPFEDDEIVIDGDVNDREVAVEEEKKRAKDWLDKRTTQTNAYIAALDKEIADRKAGKPFTEVRFRFENLERGSKKPRRPHDSSKPSLEERIDLWGRDNAWRIRGAILSLVLSIIATLAITTNIADLRPWWFVVWIVLFLVAWVLLVVGIGEKLDARDRKPR